jgi:SAM-dependent methyltransferase
MADPDWRALNRANWDERVGIHLGPRGYDLAPLRAGRGRLNAIEEAELGEVASFRILHLQCHFGKDSLVLAQRGAEVVGLDFSAPAIVAARRLADELGLAGRSRFVEADLYDAPQAISEPATFDVVFVTWGALSWLPDLRRWAEIVAHFLRSGGFLYLADAHPAALVFDDSRPMPDGRPGWFVPYFRRDPLLIDEPCDYADESARLTHATTCVWMHPLSEMIGALLDAGLRLAWLHEHDAIAWRMFASLVKDERGTYRWPEQPWLPLSFSLRAEKPADSSTRLRR